MAPNPRLHSFRTLLALAAALLGIGAAESLAQRAGAPAAVPPQPVPMEVKVRRDRRLEIPLRIYGRQSDPLKFLIRVAPAHGKLTEPRQVDKEAATVIYEPPQDLAITRDRFSYAAQSGAGVSAPADIVITITDLPPQLTMPDVLEFPATLAGETAAKVLEISNRGGGVAAGEVGAKPPWRIEGPRNYRLGAGDLAVFKITFAPAEGGSFDGAVTFSSDREHSTSLHGEALAPVAAVPPKIVLQSLPGFPVRTGAVELRNQTAEPRTLELRAGARLQIAPRITIPAHGKVTVPVQTVAADVEPLEAEIRAESPGFALAIPATAPRVGGIVQPLQPAIAFGRLSAAAPAPGSFGIENIGGAPVGVSWEIAAPFATEQSSAILLPGEKKTFALRIAPAKPGGYRAWLKIKTDQQTLDVPVAAELVAAPGSDSVAQAATSAGGAPSPAQETPPAVESNPNPEPPAPAPELAVSPEWLADPTAKTGVKIARLAPASATIEWPASLSSEAKFRIELRRLGLDANGDLAVEWTEHRPVTIARTGDKWSATLTSLKPAQPWTARVLPLNPAGQPSDRLFALDFTTPPAASLVPKVTTLRALLAVAVILILAMTCQRLRNRPR